MWNPGLTLLQTQAGRVMPGLFYHRAFALPILPAQNAFPQLLSGRLLSIVQVSVSTGSSEASSAALSSLPRALCFFTMFSTPAIIIVHLYLLSYLPPVSAHWNRSPLRSGL